MYEYEAIPQGGPPARQRRGWSFLITIVVAAALLIGIAIGANWPDRNSSFGTLPASAKVEVFDENQVQAIFNASVPAVAKVETSTSSSAPFSFRQRGQGSAFLIDDEGHFLTNYHVVDGASRVVVILESGDRLRGDVLGSDAANDLAVIAVDADEVADIAPLVFADSDQVRPGQLAIALGSPFGLQGSITLGVVSGTGRSLPSVTQRPILNMIQTDAAIFPGNSGGPLLNSGGLVIGINTAVASRGNESLGFAVPSNTAVQIIERLTAGTQVSRPWLGVSLLTLDSETAEDLGLPRSTGVLITDVVSGSPAENAGLVAGRTQQGLPSADADVIFGVDDAEVEDVNDLIAHFNGKSPGDEVTLKIHRQGRTVEIQVVLGDWPDTLS